MIEYVNAPDTEWRKVMGYIAKGSTFDKVALSCRNNQFKLKWRYLILKELGLMAEARYFGDRMDRKTVEELNNTGVRIPDLYGEKIDEWQTSGFGPFAQVDVKEKITSGPFTELTKMGVSYDIFEANLVDDNGNASAYGVKKWEPELSRIRATRIGDYGVPKILVLYNTTTTSGGNCLYVVVHESSSGTRYAIGDNPDADYSFRYAVRATELKRELQEWVRPVSAIQENPFF